MSSNVVSLPRLNSRDLRLEAFRAAYAENESSSWAMADILLQEVPVRSGPRFHDGSQDSVRSFIRDAGVPMGIDRAMALRRTSYAWPKKKRRSDRSFTLCMALAGQEDRFSLLDEIKTVAMANALVRHRSLMKHPHRVATDAIKNIERASRYLRSATHSAVVAPSSRLDEIEEAYEELSLVLAELDDVLDGLR